MNIVFAGKGDVAARGLAVLHELGIIPAFYNGPPMPPCDLFVSIHYDKKVPAEDLAIPKIGAINVHNSFLPWNKGADACSWAIIDQTPHGATVHWMEEGIDAGPILDQWRLEPAPDDTAHTLYQRTASLEVSLFAHCMKMIIAGMWTKRKQLPGGSSHKKADMERIFKAATTNHFKVIPIDSSET